ncbi:MAG TPA: polyprenyl synthetase family protein [Patescibacteria group bacterium]|nr:polyprenyl synthetase family protein [Patescibacteria group bacterium]
MITDTLEKTKALVWPDIDKYLKDPLFPIQFTIPEKFKKEVDTYWKINREYPERKGKYLRPTAVLLIAQALNGDIKKAVAVAAAMQLSEEWILIHDDIEDNSDERRGKASLHKIYGPELAINAGDALHMIMWKMVNDVGSKEVSDEFYKMLMRTALGQGVEQMWNNEKSGKIDNDQYFFVADSKSAYYSIAGPMRLGAIVAGASKDQIDKITEFGLYLGRCFQLVDDILDLEQDKKESKVTLANTQGVDYTRKLAEEMKQKAKDIFEKDLGFLNSEPARTELKELTDFILDRKY